jgi:hypothetical protein
MMSAVDASSSAGWGSCHFCADLHGWVLKVRALRNKVPALSSNFVRRFLVPNPWTSGSTALQTSIRTDFQLWVDVNDAYVAPVWP